MNTHSTHTTAPRMTQERIPQALDSMVLISVSIPKHRGRKGRLAMIVVPLDGVTLDTLVDLTNSNDPWMGLTDNGISFLRPMTIPTLVRGVDMCADAWEREKEQVSILLHETGCSIKECSLLVTRESDGAAWTLTLPPISPRDAMTLTGITE